MPQHPLHMVEVLAVLGSLGAACVPELVNGGPTACRRALLTTCATYTDTFIGRAALN